MTGFGQASSSDRNFSTDVVVRTVNGRHLKTKVRMSLNMPTVCDRISALAARYIRRGTVEVAVRIDWARPGGVVFNQRIMAGYVTQLKAMRETLGLAGQIHLDRVAMLPGALEADVSSAEADRVWRKLRPVVIQALERTARMRASEGRALARALRRHARRIDRLLARVERRAGAAARRYRQRLTRRVRTLLEEAGTRLEPGSLAREVVLFSERSDISEELCRTRAHVAHLTQALGEEGTGRKLEFIGQEMHREVNTMASKASDPAMTELIIDLRGEVDKIREQVLNLA